MALAIDDKLLRPFRCIEVREPATGARLMSMGTSHRIVAAPRGQGIERRRSSSAGMVRSWRFARHGAARLLRPHSDVYFGVEVRRRRDRGRPRPRLSLLRRYHGETAYIARRRRWPAARAFQS